MNTLTNSLESMRTDIPKDMIPPEDRRVEGVDYLIADQPDKMNMKPIYKLINKTLAQIGKK